MDCLNNIIGLSRTECECLLPAGSDDAQEIQESASGIYLDELDGFNINVAEGADDCAKGSLFDRMYRARENAIQDFITHTLGCINRKFKPRADVFAGQIGESTGATTANFSESQCGIKLTPGRIRSANITVNRIGIIINQAVNVTVKVYSRIQGESDGTELASYTTSSPVSAGLLTWLALEEELVLPMYSDAGRLEYYFLLQLDGTFQPKKNKKDCGCGGIKRPYLAWFDFIGTKGNDNFSNFGNTTELNGVTLDLKVTCNQSELICSEERPLDFEGSGTAREIAYAIRLKAGAKLYQDIISSDQINRHTMLNREYIEKKIEEWNAEYSNWVEWYCGAINVEANDCFVCRDGKNIGKSGILA